MADDFLTPAHQSAAAMKEMFDGYIEVGFTEKQAIQILVAMMKAYSEDAEGQDD